MKKVKILSGWSNPGGSTIHFIDLCNLLNDNGFDCTFYGPHEWHLGKCRSDLSNSFILDPSDVLITHFLRPQEKLDCRYHIFSCHETNMYPINQFVDEGKLHLENYDVIHFVSNSQKKWHAVNHPSVIIPPVVSKIAWEDPKNKTAGVVGNIDSHKQVHLSVKRALEDGFKKVLLFGNVSDPEYFNEGVKPWMDTKDVVLVGHLDDKESMYSQISAVYHSSKRETYGLVEAECKLAGIPFNGPSNNQDILDKDEILERWVKILTV